MTNLQELVANYPLVEPAISFVCGAVVGTATRIYQNRQTKKSTWKPIGSGGAGVALAFTLDSNAIMYPIDIGAALVGDYIAAKVVDKLTYRK